MDAVQRPTNPTVTLGERQRRVKLYVLNEQRSWDDKGTGHVTCGQEPGSNFPALKVTAEKDGAMLLDSKILPETAYQKQQETLIVWSEGENCDLALSFQEKSGCDDVWEKICQVQGRDPSVDMTQEPQYENESDDSNENTTNLLAQNSCGGMQLPPCELNKLVEIQDLFASCLQSPTRRESLALAIESEKYIPKLLDLFRMAEDLEGLDSLHLLHKIIRHILFLNKHSLLEVLFSDEHLKEVVGVLEYDPNIKGPRKEHRKFLWEKAKFKEVIPIQHPSLRAKIHQTYRIQYIQDAVLPAPSIFEENMLSSLNSFLFFNRVEIVNLLQEDEAYLCELFRQLSEISTNCEQRRELTLFLKEFCSLAQTLQPPQKEQFFRTLSVHGILMSIERCLLQGDAGCRSAATEIFAMLVDHCPSIAREYMIKQARDQSISDSCLLMNALISQLFNDPDPELSSATQMLSVIRILVDPENMLATTANGMLQKSEKQEFLSLFYKRCMNSLCMPLFDNTKEDTPKIDDYHTANRLSLIVEVLSFCIEHHTYHVRTFVISKDVLRRVLVLLKSTHTFLALAALRLFRRVIQLKDEFYNRHIIKMDLFRVIAHTFNANGNRYNLLNSALLEMFEYIRMEDIKSLICHICDNYYDYFAPVNYVRTFQSLKLRYDQHKDRATAAQVCTYSKKVSSPSSPPRPWKRTKSVDEDEEWFHEEDEEWTEGQSWLPGTRVSSTELPSGAKTPPIEECLEMERQKSASAPPPKRIVASSEDDDFPPLMRPRTPVIQHHQVKIKTSPNSNTPMKIKLKTTQNLDTPSTPPSVTPITVGCGLGSPATTPANSPSEQSSRPTVIEQSDKSNANCTQVPRKGLVDYDYDSDEEEDDNFDPDHSKNDSGKSAESADNKSVGSPKAEITRDLRKGVIVEIEKDNNDEIKQENKHEEENNEPPIKRAKEQ